MNVFKHSDILYYYKTDVENWTINTNRPFIFFKKKAWEHISEHSRNIDNLGDQQMFNDCNSFTAAFLTSVSVSSIFSKQG